MIISPLFIKLHNRDNSVSIVNASSINHIEEDDDDHAGVYLINGVTLHVNESVDYINSKLK